MIAYDTNQIETEIIATFIIDKESQGKIRELSEEDFTDKRNKYFFNVIQKMFINKQEIDYVSLRNSLTKGNSNDKKIVDALDNYIENMVTVSAIDSNIEKLKDISTRNNLQKSLDKANKAIEDFENIEEIKGTLIKDLKGISNFEKMQAINITDALIITLDDMEEQKNKKEQMSTGFRDLDILTDGLHRNELTCIGARPGTGKTAFALNIAANIAKKSNVYFCSLEMSETQLVQRLLGRYSLVNTQFLRNGKIKPEEYERVATATNNIVNLKLKIDTKSRYIEEIETTITNLKEKGEVDILIIDYLTLLKSKFKYQSRELEVADISRRLKLLALDLHIPIIILVQLNREAENKVPTMANIRESGSIEQNCDNIIFLYDPEQEENKLKTKIQIILEKQRQGRTGKLDLCFDKKYSLFESYEK